MGIPFYHAADQGRQPLLGCALEIELRIAEKSMTSRLFTRKQLMEHGSQAVDVREGSDERVVLRGCIAWRAKILRVFFLIPQKTARNTKVDEAHMNVRCYHDVCRFEIAKDDGRLASMEIGENGSQFNTELDNRRDRQQSRPLP